MEVEETLRGNPKVGKKDVVESSSLTVKILTSASFWRRISVRDLAVFWKRNNWLCS